MLLLPLSVQAALVNINTANATLLDTLPGIGPAKATAIVEYRTLHGPFVRIEDIQKVKGIGPSTFAQLEPMISISGATVVQPLPTQTGLNKRQTIESPTQNSNTISTNDRSPNESEHGTDAVRAPEASSTLVASGAFVPAASLQVTDLVHTPWTIVFLGIVAVAGAALMIL